MAIPRGERSIVDQGREDAVGAFSEVVRVMTDAGQEVGMLSDDVNSTVRIDTDEGTVTFKHDYHSGEYPYTYSRSVACETSGEVTLEESLIVFPDDLNYNDQRRLRVRRRFVDGEEVGVEEVDIVVWDAEDNYYVISEGADDLIRENLHRNGEKDGTVGEVTEADRDLWANMREDFLEALSEEFETAPYIQLASELREQLALDEGEKPFGKVLEGVWEGLDGEYEGQSPPLYTLSLVLERMIARSMGKLSGHTQIFRFGGRPVYIHVDRSFHEEFPSVEYRVPARKARVEFERIEDSDPQHIRSQVWWSEEEAHDFQIVDIAEIEFQICQALANITGEPVLQVLRVTNLEKNTLMRLGKYGYQMIGATPEIAVKFARKDEDPE